MPTHDPGPPSADEYAPAHEAYLSRVPAGPVMDTLRLQVVETLEILAGLDDAQALTVQAPYRWNFKEVVGHMIDTERVMCHRALGIARGDRTPLASFDENDYARAAGSSAFPIADLAAEFQAVRASTLWLFTNLDPAAWTRTGIANNARVSVRALAHIIAGHEKHHQVILRARREQLSA